MKDPSERKGAREFSTVVAMNAPKYPSGIRLCCVGDSDEADIGPAGAAPAPADEDATSAKEEPSASKENPKGLGSGVAACAPADCARWALPTLEKLGWPACCSNARLAARCWSSLAFLSFSFASRQSTVLWARLLWNAHHLGWRAPPPPPPDLLPPLPDLPPPPPGFPFPRLRPCFCARRGQSPW